jgi:hypothetical protein
VKAPSRLTTAGATEEPDTTDGTFVPSVTSASSHRTGRYRALKQYPGEERVASALSVVSAAARFTEARQHRGETFTRFPHEL